MLEIIEAINSKVNAFIWGVPAISRDSKALHGGVFYDGYRGCNH